MGQVGYVPGQHTDIKLILHSTLQTVASNCLTQLPGLRGIQYTRTTPET